LDLASVVTPKFEKGLPSDPAKYRYISLIYIASKLMEAVIKDTFLTYVKSSALLNDWQLGFLKRKMYAFT
jgi:cyanate lyase